MDAWKRVRCAVEFAAGLIIAPAVATAGSEPVAAAANGALGVVLAGAADGADDAVATAGGGAGVTAEATFGPA